MFTLNDILIGNKNSISVFGSCEQDSRLTFRSAQHDSRCVQAGDLYVAIKGARVDGHRFLPDVMQARARAALCTVPDLTLPASFLQLVVPDTIKALQATARVRVRCQHDTIRIGITGTNGKTTTKEAIAAVLACVAPTLKTHASYNNELGYPLTLLNLEPDHRYAVLEMGAERVGELRGVCETIARPHWSVITTVGAAHLEHFGSLENVAIAKSELVQCLTADGFAILNYDDPNVRAMGQKTHAHVLFYGLEKGSTVRGRDLVGDSLSGYGFTLQVEDKQTKVQLPLPGEHGVYTALAAATVGHVAGVPLDVIVSALESLSTPKGRGEVLIGPNGCILINDTYNAARQSIMAMVRTMQTHPLAAEGKRWAVLGEVQGQGAHSRGEHEAIGAFLSGAVDCLVAIGDNARFFVEGAIRAGMPSQNTYYFPADIANSAEVENAKRAIAKLLKEDVHSSDMVLIKGSRGVKMETLLDMF